MFFSGFMSTMKKLLYFISLCCFVLFSSIVISAHPGSLDSNGGHYNRTTGEYHYHEGTHTTGDNNNTQTNIIALCVVLGLSAIPFVCFAISKSKKMDIIMWSIFYISCWLFILTVFILVIATETSILKILPGLLMPTFIAFLVKSIRDSEVEKLKKSKEWEDISTSNKMSDKYMIYLDKKISK